MSEDLEALAADLSLDGGTAFGKLQGNVTSQLKVPFERDGKTEARQFIIDKFAAFDAEMSDFARRAFDEQWIDAEPRDGKRGGAVTVHGPREG